MTAIVINYSAISIGNLELDTFQRDLCYGIQLMNDEAAQRLVEELQYISLVVFNLDSLG